MFPFNGAYYSLYIRNDDISNFAAIPTLFAIKFNFYFLTYQYLIIINSQSKHAMSIEHGRQ